MRSTVWALTLWTAVAMGAGPAGAAQTGREAGKIAFDFETGDPQGWRVVEGAFGSIVCDKKMYRNHPKRAYNKQGRYYLTTLEMPNGQGNAKLAGVVESPVFVLSAAKVSLMVGGGSHFNTYVALCTLDGKEAMKAHGRNTEIFHRVQWDAGKLVGRAVFLRVVDGHPAGWGYLAIDDVRAAGRLDPAATKQRLAARKPILAGMLASPAVGRRAARAAPRPAGVDTAALGAAIRDLTATFGRRYPGGAGYLARLAALSKTPNPSALAALRREALLANPLVRDRPILFVVRQQYHNNHGTEATMCQTGEINTQFFRAGGAMKVLDLADGPKVTTLLAAAQGVVRDPEVSFDAKRVLLAMRRDVKDDYHIHEMDLATRKVTQLTFARRVSDIQPIYLPDGRIAFSSTREPKYIPCQRHLMSNLFTMEADGANIRQIGHNTQFEGRPSLLDDGRIVYTRWEYVDKHFASAYGLWTANPDGTNHMLHYGGYAWQPGPIIDARPIPGTRKFVAVYAAVHGLGWGAMVVVDRTRGMDGLDPIEHNWPANITPYMKHWDREERIGGGVDSFRNVPVKYEDPYPLHDPAAPAATGKYFLCSRQTGRGGAMALFLVDTFGNEVLVHAEGAGCFDPIPLAPRDPPPVIAPRVDLGRSDGTFYVQNVYQGEFMDRVKPGIVKFLRVVEAPPKLTFPQWNIGDWTPALTPDGHHPVAVNWNHYNHKRILGTAPVEVDGSAYFRVPAGRFVYFQLLDAEKRMIHSMRSGTMLQPGERAACGGCHDRPLSAAGGQPDRQTAALRKPPHDLSPWYGPARNFSFAAEVQPVLDKHCIRCHDYGKKGAKLILTGDKGPAFSLSYTHLLARSPAVWSRPKPTAKKPLVNIVGAGPTKIIPPEMWGSRHSRLIDMHRAGHNKVRLDAESIERLATWIDLNAPYYPSHVTRYTAHTFGRCPLTHKELAELGRLALAAPGKARRGWKQVNNYSVGDLNRLIMTAGSPINFTRPARSLCLAGFTDPNTAAYRRALAIIEQGAARLRAHPRADMPGFVPCDADRARVEFHARRLAVETHTRRMIHQGRRVYDHPDPLRLPQPRP